jgi:hypothetical protein
LNKYKFATRRCRALIIKAPIYMHLTVVCSCAEVILSTLRGDGSVLIPVDAAGRMLEVALLLDEFWAQEK